MRLGNRLFSGSTTIHPALVNGSSIALSTCLNGGRNGLAKKHTRLFKDRLKSLRALATSSMVMRPSLRLRSRRDSHSRHTPEPSKHLTISAGSSQKSKRQPRVSSCVLMPAQKLSDAALKVLRIYRCRLPLKSLSHSKVLTIDSSLSNPSLLKKWYSEMLPVSRSPKGRLVKKIVGFGMR